MDTSMRRLGPAEVATLQALATLFGDAFDDSAIALYATLGTREEVLHFDIAVPDAGDT